MCCVLCCSFIKVQFSSVFLLCSDLNEDSRQHFIPVNNMIVLIVEYHNQKDGTTSRRRLALFPCRDDNNQRE